MNYSEKFALFGLSVATQDDYTTAEQYSKKFERCTVLSHDNVSYTPATPASKKKELQCWDSNSTCSEKVGFQPDPQQTYKG